jgi:hypothetical protein
VCSKCQQVREDVRCAAEVNRLATHVDDGHRRFRRDSRHVAPDKLVEHHVAQHDDITIAKRVQDFSNTDLS